MLTSAKVAKIGFALFVLLLLSALPVLGAGSRRAPAALLTQALSGAAEQSQSVDRASTRTIAVETSTEGCDWNLMQCLESGAGDSYCNYRYCLCRADGGFWESLGCALFAD